MGADKHEQLDQLDELVRQFQPIEQLFRVMSAAGDVDEGGELVRSYGLIGTALVGNFRKALASVFSMELGTQRVGRP